jgi:hypothetical protein
MCLAVPTHEVRKPLHDLGRTFEFHLEKIYSHIFIYMARSSIHFPPNGPKDEAWWPFAKCSGAQQLRQQFAQMLLLHNKGKMCFLPVYWPSLTFSF